MTYSKTVRVTSEHIDNLHHVNNIVYLQWILEVAEDHWNSATDSELRAKYGWVVLSHFVEYKNPAIISDHLTIETWVEEENALSCKRHTLIKKNEEVLVTAETRWCPISMKSLKPTRMIPSLIAPFTRG